MSPHLHLRRAYASTCFASIRPSSCSQKVVAQDEGKKANFMVYVSASSLRGRLGRGFVFLYALPWVCPLRRIIQEVLGLRISHILLKPRQRACPGVHGGFGIIPAAGIVVERVVGAEEDHLLVNLVIRSHGFFDGGNAAVDTAVVFAVHSEHCGVYVLHV